MVAVQKLESPDWHPDSNIVERVQLFLPHIEPVVKPHYDWMDMQAQRSSALLLTDIDRTVVSTQAYLYDLVVQEMHRRGIEQKLPPIDWIMSHPDYQGSLTRALNAFIRDPEMVTYYRQLKSDPQNYDLPPMEPDIDQSLESMRQVHIRVLGAPTGRERRLVPVTQKNMEKHGFDTGIPIMTVPDASADFPEAIRQAMLHDITAFKVALHITLAQRYHDKLVGSVDDLARPSIETHEYLLQTMNTGNLANMKNFLYVGTWYGQAAQSQNRGLTTVTWQSMRSQIQAADMGSMGSTYHF